jgi:hypothetical protein
MMNTTKNKKAGAAAATRQLRKEKKARKQLTATRQATSSFLKGERPSERAMRLASEDKNWSRKMVTLTKGGDGERTVAVASIQIPDLWHIANALPEPDRSAVLTVWHLAHDLKKALL